MMHFVLVLLFCSLITGVSTTGQHKTRKATADDAFKLKPGQIIGVRPGNFVVSRGYAIGDIIIR